MAVADLIARTARVATGVMQSRSFVPQGFAGT